MAMIGSVAREYLDVIYKIGHAQFRGKSDLRWLEGQRRMLHDQLERLIGKHVTVAIARRLAARSR